MTLLLPLIIILVLVLLNGLFVAAEFALVGAPRTSIEKKAKQGDRVAKFLSRVLSDPRLQDRYIATAQLGITLASLGLGMYGEHALASWVGSRLEASGASWTWLKAHSLASVLSVAFLTYLHIVLGEMVPKSLALQYPERSAFWVTPPVRWFQLALYPVVIGLNQLGDWILRLVGIQRQAFSSEHYHTPEELQFVIEESQESGMLREDSGEMLQDLLEFGDLEAREVMVPRTAVVGIPLDATNEDVLEVLSRSAHTRYPIYRDDLDHIVGMVHIKDLLRNRLSGSTLSAEVVRSVPFVPGSSTLESVLRAMRTNSTQMAIVMDEYGGTAGILTIEDLFEEIVGDIDEGGTSEPEIQRDISGSLHVLGTVRLEEVGEHFDLILENDKVDTVSGLLLMLLDRPPKVGDVVHYGGFEWKVLSVEGHGVRKCLVTWKAAPESS